MSNTHLVPLRSTNTVRAIILPDDLEYKLKTENNGSRRAIASRLGLFADWLEASGRDWTEPDLAAYRNTMLASGKSASTVNAHLSTIRSRYRVLLKDRHRMAELDARAQAACEANGWEVNPANLGAMVTRVLTTIYNAIDASDTSAKEKKIQDRTASEFIRLTRQQADRLIAAPGTDTLMTLRDTALIALALSTGARAAELSALQVGDHRARTEGGAVALLIRQGKGAKQRLVPYGELEDVIIIIDVWLKQARITEGPIFRSFWRGGKKVRSRELTVVAIEQIVGSYPININGELRSVKPHDLRRTYARLAWEAGMKPVAIQQNLGHASLETTLRYIGSVDDEHRKPPALLRFNLAALPSDQMG